MSVSCRGARAAFLSWCALLAPASASYCPTSNLNSSSEVTRCISSSRSRSSACLLFSLDLNLSKETLNWSQSSTICSTFLFHTSRLLLFSCTTRMRHWLSICCVTFCSSRSFACMSLESAVLDWIVPLASAPSSCSCDGRELFGVSSMTLQVGGDPEVAQRMLVEIHHAPCRFASLWSAFGRRRTGPATTPCLPTRTTQPFSSGCGGTSGPKRMGVAGVKDVFEREERAYVLFARRARTSRQPRARPYGLLRRGRGPQILFCAVPCQRTQTFRGQQRSYRTIRSTARGRRRHRPYPRRI